MMRVPIEREQRPPGRYEEHHVFGGPCRKWSEEYNCVIYLTPEMHRGTNGIHRNKAFRLRVQQEFQRRLETAGWTRKEFIDTFLRSRL